jgi:DinB superfamily
VGDGHPVAAPEPEISFPAPEIAAISTAALKVLRITSTRAADRAVSSHLVGDPGSNTDPGSAETIADQGTSPDPVADPLEYQRTLLAMLGDDDPAEAQAETPGLLRDLVASAGRDLPVGPAPREWSALQCVGHITDAEVVMAARYRWVLAHDRPALVGYDQDLWVDGLGHAEDDPGELLGLFESLRAANLRLWSRTGPEGRARIGLHEERGPESFELMFRMLAGHDRLHLQQARRALELVAAART